MSESANLLELVLSQASPDDIAITCGPDGIRYADISRLVATVDQALDTAKIPPRSVVGLTSFSSVYWPVIALAVIASDRVFVPFPVNDRFYDRSSQLNQIRPTALIGRLTDIERLQSDTRHSRVCGEISMSAPLSRTQSFTISDTAFPSSPNSELRMPDIGYLVFSSGSTGSPKCIKGSTRGLVNFIEWQCEKFCFPRSSRFSQITNPVFDPVYRELFAAWHSGGTVIVPPARDLIAAPDRLHRFLYQNDITVLHSVPALLRGLYNRSSRREPLHALRYIFSAGDQLYRTDVANLHCVAPAARITNLYGPSETTLAKFYHEVTGLSFPGPRVPVGKSIPGSSAIVLDESNMPCIPGEIGEVYIRSNYRSHGYLRNDELNGERFVANPFGTSASDILFKTGDLAFELPSGDLVLVGRADQRLKVRGLWVEVTEVEASLRALAPTKELCVVAPSPQAGDDQSLACFVVGESADCFAIAKVASSLLALHQIPTSWIPVAKLPTTETGKYDRLVLRLEAERYPGPDLKTRSAVPNNAIEQVVLDIWKTAITRTRDIEVDTNFFSLGGQSIEAAQIAALLSDRFQIEIPIRLVYEKVTARALSQIVIAALIKRASPYRDAELNAIKVMIDGGDTTSADAEIANLSRSQIEEVAVLASASTPRVREIAVRAGTNWAPLTDAQNRFLMLEKANPSNRSLIHTFAVEVTGKIDVALLRRALNIMLARHSSLRVSIDADQKRQVLRPCVEFPIDIHDCTGEVGDIEVMMLERAQRAFDISVAPLLRVDLFFFGDERCIFLLSGHVIVSDGRSKQIWLADIAATYNALVEGRTLPGSIVAPDFFDFAWSQFERNSTEKARSVAYWREALRDAPWFLPMPYDSAPVGTVNELGDTIHVALEDSSSRRIFSLAQSLRTTTNTILLTGMFLAIEQWTGQSDIILKLPHNNRSIVSLQEVTGCFTDSVVLRARPNLSDVSGTIQAINQNVTEALDHSDIGFEQIAEAAGVGRQRYDPAAVPVMFAPQPNFASGFNLIGTQVRPLNLRLPTAIMNLHVFSFFSEGHAEFDINYSTSVFTQRKVAEFGQALVSAIGWLVRNVG